MITCDIKGHSFTFKTNDRCFSPAGVDKGTLAMLSMVDFSENDRIIDLGCGYGVVGIVAAKFTHPSNIYMLDIDEDSLDCARENIILNGVQGVTVLKSDAYDSLDATAFDYILSNPPYHTDFSVAKRFIEKGFNRLKLGGKMILVTKRLKWYQNKMSSIFGGVKVHEIDGYFVFISEKRQERYSGK